MAKNRVFRLILVVIIPFFIACNNVNGKGASCPSTSKIRENLRPVLKDYSLEVVSVVPVKEIEGICEVFVKIEGESRIFYIDKSARFLLTGTLIDLVEGVNLTRERMYQLDVVTSDYLKELSKLVSFEYKKGPKYIYFITDPDCPVCRKAEEPLLKWADRRNVTIKVVLLPIKELHPEAYGKSVSLICENRGFQDYINKNFGNSDCKAGREKVDSAISLAKRIGVSGTPTFIGMNGKKIVGLPSNIEELDNLLK
ncbi:MAG: DsbC family protein [candidate division WOR-3 bacterium]